MTRHAVLLLALVSCKKAPPAALPEPVEPPEIVLEAWFIDVGQGDSTLLAFPCGAVLIDTGGEHNPLFDATPVVRNTLDAVLDGRELDGLFLTHPHADHVRNADDIAVDYGVEHVVTNGADRRGAQRKLHTWAAAHATAESVREPVPLGGQSSDTIDPVSHCAESPIDPQIRVFHGHSGDDDRNNNSLVIRVDVAETSLLFTGDLEAPGIADLLERHGEDLDVDVLQVGHHGSRDGTTAGLLEATTPEVAVISMGPADRTHDQTGSCRIAAEYAHPHAEAVELLLGHVSGERAPVEVPVGLKGRFGCSGPPATFETWTVDRAVYGTGWDGTVVLRADADGQITIQTNP